MNLLLINPWITDFAAYDLWSKPLGLIYAGAFLRAWGHSVRLVDCMHRFQGPEGYVGGEARPYGTGKFHREVITKPACLAHVPRYFCRYGIPEEMFRSLVREGPKPDAILVTCVMTYWYPGAFEAIRLLRELLPGAPIALGGIYATLCPYHAREHSGADAVITEARPSGVVKEVENLVRGGELDDGDNTDDAAGVQNFEPLPRQQSVSNHSLDPFPSWPEPAWELYEHLPAAAVMTSRGCPMRCTACASHLLCDSFERREPRDSASAILALAGRDARDIAFYDDALLLAAPKYAAPLFAALGDEGAPVRLHTPNGLHVREITPELAALMRRAGITTIRLSLETASDENARARFSGKVSREHFRRAVAALLGAGFAPDDLGAYVLSGLPGQRPEEAYDTVAFSHACGVKVRPALFSPVPGTTEFDRAVESGLLSPGDDPLLHNNTLRTLDLWDGGNAYERFRWAVSEGNERLGASA
ncbi:MAG: B12-binding domain-containing radical SAM protein [Candidatus Latescibacterota bacterium]